MFNPLKIQGLNKMIHYTTENSVNLREMTVMFKKIRCKV